MPNQDKGFMSTRMHFYQGVECVLMQEEKCSTLFIKSTKEAWVELPNMHVELSIMEHGSTIF